MDKNKEIEMELKPYETMCEHTTEHLKMLITGSQEASADEILAVAKTLGEITDIKKDIVEMCYKKQIMTAMEESEYGEDYDENGRKFYRTRDSKGRYTRYYEEPMMGQNNATRNYNQPMHYDSRMSEDMRDMDRHTMRRMYSEPMHNESKYEKMMREYTESKSMNPENKQIHQDKMNKAIDALSEEFKEKMPMMDATERGIIRTKLTNLANTF